MVYASSRKMNKIIDAVVIRQTYYKLSKFDCTSLISIHCEFSPHSHEQHYHHIRLGTLVIITLDEQEQCFGFISRVSNLNGQKNSDFNIFVSDNFHVLILSNNKKIRIRILEDDINIKLETVVSLAELKNSPLMRMILQPKRVNFDRARVPRVHTGMEIIDRDQLNALCTILEKIKLDKPSISFVEGGPGTGKTRLIANLVRHLLRCSLNTEDKPLRILLCAPSDSVVDAVTEKLMGFREEEDRKIINLVRFGDGISPNVEMCGVEMLLKKMIIRERNVSLNAIYKLKQDILVLPTEREKNKVKIMEMNEELKKLEQKMLLMDKSYKDFVSYKYKAKRTLLSGANIISCTLTSCPSLLSSSEGKFDIAIIDAATQANECTCIMALNSGVKHLIMVGDIKQRPSGVRDPKAKALGLGQSLITRIASFKPNYLSLRTQHRMHEEILKFSNEYFYESRMRNGSNLNATNQYKLKPYLVVDLNNSDEIQFVTELVRMIKALTHPTNYSIGVVTPYPIHKKLVEEKLG